MGLLFFVVSFTLIRLLNVMHLCVIRLNKLFFGILVFLLYYSMT